MIHATVDFQLHQARIERRDGAGGDMMVKVEMAVLVMAGAAGAGGEGKEQLLM